MQRVRMLIPRLRSGSADTSVESYADLGSGTIDYARPLPPGRKQLWQRSAAHVGHVQVGHLMIGHLDTTQEDGHVEGVHLTEGHLEPTAVVVMDSPRYVFGRFRHALRMFDDAGNASAMKAGEVVHTINSSPPVPLGLARSAWNATTRQLLLTFTPVRFRPVIGN
ncbi:MAG: hypothetical protein GXP29_07285 [Planctomycetes bacterium]|nr:hypothetical protein [Planctomycetota bacterium]